MSYYRSSESSYPPSAEYEHEKFDEYRRLQQRVSYRNKKFKDEVKWHPFWTQEERLACQHEHDAYIKRYKTEDSTAGSAIATQSSRRKLQAIQSGRVKSSANEHVNTRHSSATILKKRGRQWRYNHFEEEKRRYESQKSRRQEHAERDAQEREEKQRQRAVEEDRQTREKESRERRRKQAEESERLKEQRYKSYEDGWSPPRATWKTKTNILFNDIPWPTLYHPQSADAITPKVVTSFFEDPRYLASEHWISRKKRIRTELLRWHSDKF
ncbi:hypothetical protein ARMGADRAFT_1122833 [Armillaria gallica]|uniref:Uncharacterized protein n=1 Tax=Armillaria gallica TaxID=47427 RepID=A0A2H3CZW4_ARMGA|nr:hypothetical protein ARMGADRAFT_1122833 [Armillaria gallica]